MFVIKGTEKARPFFAKELMVPVLLLSKKAR
jgi:hypothetical protein